MFLSSVTMAQIDIAWSDQVGDPNWGAMPVKMLKDSNGNVYVIGTYSSNTIKMLVVKYTQTGTKLWQTVWVAPSGNAPTPVDAALDANNNVYVAANDLQSVAFLFKFDSGGLYQWNRMYLPRTKSRGTSVTVDPDGNPILVGRTQNYPQPEDNFIVKYAPNSDQTFAQVVNPGVGQFDWTGDVVTDAGGNSYMCGQLSIPDGSGPAVGKPALWKYSAAGTLLWTRVYEVGAGVYGANRKIRMGPDGNLVMVGITAIDASFVTKYDTEGNQIWVYPYVGNFTDAVHGFLIDPVGDILVPGYTAPSNRKTIQLVKVSASGQVLFNRSYTPSTDPMLAIGVCTDEFGNYYVGAGGIPNHLLVKWSNDGTQIWASTTSTPASALLKTMCVGSNGRIFTASQNQSNNMLSMIGFVPKPFLAPIATVAPYQSVLTGSASNLATINGQVVQVSVDPAGQRAWQEYGFIAEATCPVGHIDSIALDSVAMTTASGVMQRMYLYDYVAGEYVMVDERAAVGTFTASHAESTGVAQRFVHPTTGKLLVKFTWFNPPGATPSRQAGKCDYLAITVRN
jgi:hypothetical protein